MRYLRIKNWTEFQHYKDRNPPWIKLHRSLLDDYEFSRLPDGSKGQLVMLWLFASQNDGKIPEDARFLQRRLSFDKPPDLNSFIGQGLLIPEQGASEPLADSKQDAMPRREEERREEETTFSQFWLAYPRKAAKPDAIRAWRKLALQNGDLEKLMSALERFKASDGWQGNGGKYIPHPATWLNKRRWEDEAIEEPQRRFVV